MVDPSAETVYRHQHTLAFRWLVQACTLARLTALCQDRASRRWRTEFASLTAAYAALPEQRKADIEELIAEHSLANSRAQIAPNLMSEVFQKDTPPVNQRLVRTIPETGKKALLVGSYTTPVHGLPIEKGKTLLKELLEWSAQPQFVYRHTWQVNDLVVYDNCCCLHRGRSWDREKYKRFYTAQL